MTAPTKTAPKPAETKPKVTRERKPRVQLDLATVTPVVSDERLDTSHGSALDANPQVREWVKQSWVGRKDVQAHRGGELKTIQHGATVKVPVPSAAADQVRSLIVKAGVEGGVTIRWGKPVVSGNVTTLSFAAVTKQETKTSKK